MRRSTALRVVFLACPPLIAISVTAAPAPVHRPKVTTPWVTGWDKPVDLLGDCGFTKAGDKLTITVPGKGHGFRDESERTSAPHLLHEIEGDFDVEVRIVGDFRLAKRAKGEMRRGAGIALTDGKTFARFGRFVTDTNIIEIGVLTPTQSGSTHEGQFGLLEPTYLRLERRKNWLTMKYSTDRLKWKTPFERGRVSYPNKVKVGVFAESMAPGVFEPVFDRFELTPAK